ncbi:hypothetical protein G7Z17_g4061 [Cylindrodendrum hubeiense]|uniref:Uncharacterized protein n=1 Tax=Cylindrodendrum hubeiense TaxID=595255 RepID=A0A9P5LD14_9HYPO|nr:hypothetical protein G7Z17_g4061 [Cylindrodendrum hubeiense]
MEAQTDNSQSISAPADLQQRNMESYNVIAEKFNAWTTKHHQIRLAYLAELCTKVPQLAAGGRSARVLELGCGGGFVLDKLLGDNPNLTAVANDLSPKQMDISRGILTPYAPRVEFEQGDMENLTFPPESFDAVIGLFSLLHLGLEEQATMIDKIRKWLRHGGCLLVNFPRDAWPWRVWEQYVDDGVTVLSTGMGVEGSLKMIRDNGLDVEKAEVEGIETETFLQKHDFQTLLADFDLAIEIYTMDTILEAADYFVFDKAYASAFHAPVFTDNATVSSPSPSPDSLFPATILSAIPRDDIYRQCLSLFLIASFGATAIYFVSATLSYYLIFDRRLEHHPRFLKNQVRQEINCSLFAIPIISVLTLPFFLSEVRGGSLLYTNFDDYGWGWVVVSTLLYMLFNDIGIYWIHRLEHHPSIYKYVHKPHHKWIIPTPWAAIAFHPVDGYVQSLPYHVFVFICPMQKYLYMVLFVMVQIWTILIHDGDMITGHWLEKFINSPAHHTLHHMYFTCNYGQYFTWADTYWDSHKAPQPSLDPIHDALKVMRAKGLIDENDNPIAKPKAE